MDVKLYEGVRLAACGLSRGWLLFVAVSFEVWRGRRRSSRVG